MVDIPVINIASYIPGMLEFVSSLEFECVILIDEAEKTYRNDEPEASQILLKMIDGVMNKSRKLYILTTNSLNINENLIGRPGRIRYIQSFTNISAKAINEYIADNLKVPEAKESILNLVESLEVSTIDTLKSIVDEANIHGVIEDGNNLNLSISTTYVDMLYFRIDGDDNQELEEKRFQAGKEFIARFANREKPVSWSFHTRFVSAKHDPNWDWENPIDEWQEENEFEGSPDELMEDVDEETRGRIQSLEGEIKAVVRKRASSNKCCGETEKVSANATVVQDRDSKGSEMHFVSEYLREKFHIYDDILRLKGVKIQVGMWTDNFGEIYKEKDGWFYSRRGDREYRIFPQTPRARNSIYRGELLM